MGKRGQKYEKKNQVFRLNHIKKSNTPYYMEETGSVRTGSETVKH